MTYSIIARDPATGEMGCAVQSHFFSVGPVVPWGEAGTGMVAIRARSVSQSAPLLRVSHTRPSRMSRGVSASIRRRAASSDAGQRRNGCRKATNCCLRSVWSEIEDATMRVLNSYTIADLADRDRAGTAARYAI